MSRKKCGKHGKPSGTWSKNGGPEYLGGYEKIDGKRMFTLVRIPKRGPVKKKTLYFGNPQKAKDKGWVQSK